MNIKLYDYGLCHTVDEKYVILLYLNNDKGKIRRVYKKKKKKLKKR